MKFALINEGSRRAARLDTPTIYHEIIETIDACEANGWDVFGCSEQHRWPDLPGIPSIATVTSPEIFYAIAAQRTNRIKIRTAIASLPLHHPLLVAEQMATLDIVSKGRMEFGTGRGNSYLAADAFGIPLEETYERWEESLRAVVGAWTAEDEFSWDGKYWKIPPGPFNPRPVQDPHPPILHGALSPQSHELAGKLGLGLLTGTAGVTLDRVAKRIKLYRDAHAAAVPVSPKPNEYVSLSVLGHCAEDNVTARAEGEKAFIDYFTAATVVYSETVHRLDSSVNFSQISSKYNFEGMSETAMIVCGTPDVWNAKISELAELGIDELTINFAGVEHKPMLRAMELLGEHVFPNFR